jgi:hypothetical protein
VAVSSPAELTTEEWMAKFGGHGGVPEQVKEPE